MNSKVKLLVFTGYALLITLAFLGSIVAITVLPQNKTIADGIVGLAVWFLAYHLFISPKRQYSDKRNLGELLTTFPVNLRFFISAFLGAIVLGWALWRILGALVYLFQLMFRS